ncbi:MAG: alpha-mannosidase [Verrucomicrobia bacterium]|nr:alpha-mannosidase [Verrucomicrobiota bacterium]
MPRFIQFNISRNLLERTLSEISSSVYTAVRPLEIRAWWSKEPLPFAKRKSGKLKRLKVGDKWGDVFDCAWFNFSGIVPGDLKGKNVVLRIDVNGELCVFDRRGIPVQGLTAGSVIWGKSKGKVVVPVANPSRGGERIDVWADGGCHDLFGNLMENGRIKEASIAVCEEEIRQLEYDYEVLLKLLEKLPDNTARHQQVVWALSRARAVLLPGINAATAHAARNILKPELAKRGGDSTLTVSAIGHAHIDLGWLWPIRETKRKTARTFATALRNMEKYPDYRFGASQPQQFEWIKQEHPALFRQIQQRVKDKRFEVQGCMWVEADANLAGGEALVRQSLMGKRFFMEEFGIEVRNLWLPDVFGYSAALPQILKRSGVDYFMTQKLSWSKINSFPHHSFWWQGIDGTKILTHMLPEDDYNSPVVPGKIHYLEANYKDKNVSDRALLLFGIGDGGGGPGEEHLERLRRMKNLLGIARVRQERACDFFEDWKKDAGKFVTWTGELYLEFHHGTYTTEARNKWYNRKMEFALRDAEWALCLALVSCGKKYPQSAVNDIWKEVLLYQFHDIVPGSSIKRVYDESLARYAVLREQTEKHAGDGLSLVASRVDTRRMVKPVVVFNSLPWARCEWIKQNGKWTQAKVPSMGYCAVDTVAGAKPSAKPVASSGLLENDVLRIRFHSNGSIASIFDKEAKREVIQKSAQANRLAVYADKGDAWDFAPTYAEQTPRYMKLDSARARTDGPRASLRQIYSLGHSKLTQDIVLYEGSRRIDFISHLSWKEKNAMLRTSFPVDVKADEATFEIQYGHIRRPTHQNTTWDLAKDEVPAQKWADLSEPGYGVALLNDSKYGYKVKGGVLDLNLLRSVRYPGYRVVAEADYAEGEFHHAYTDQCEHRFTYSLYPHMGDAMAGRVIAAGYELNVPLRTVAVKSQKGALPGEWAFFHVDDSNVIVEAVKKAEDGNGIIVRLYEAEGRRTRTRLQFGFGVRSAKETDLLERDETTLKVKKDSVALSFHAFEIKTIKVTEE